MGFFVNLESDGSRVLAGFGKAISSFDIKVQNARYVVPQGWSHKATGEIKGTPFEIEIARSDFDNWREHSWVSALLGPDAKVFDVDLFQRAVIWRSENPEAPLRTTDTWVEEGTFMRRGFPVANFDARILEEEKGTGEFRIETTYNGKVKIVRLGWEDLRNNPYLWERALGEGAKVDNTILFQMALFDRREEESNTP